MNTNREKREQFETALRGSLVGSVKVPITSSISGVLLNLAMKDELHSTFKLGLEDGTFSIPLYLHNLDSPVGEDLFLSEFLPRLQESLDEFLISTGMQITGTRIEAIIQNSASRGLNAIPAYLEMLWQSKYSIPFTTSSIFDDDEKLEHFTTTMKDNGDVREHQGDEDCILMSIPGISESSVKGIPGRIMSKKIQVSAITQSRIIIYKLGMRLMNRDGVLSKYTCLLDRYFQEIVSVDILLELLYEETMALGQDYFMSEEGESDLRAYSGQIVKNALAIQKDPSLPALLPAKVIEYKDYISNFAATKWTETFKKRLRRARAEQEKQRSAPEPLRLTEFILPVNDIDE